MKCPTIFANESERLKALTAYGLDDEQMIRSLDPVVHIASRMFDMPVAAVNMIGNDHVFFAASVGVTPGEVAQADPGAGTDLCIGGHTRHQRRDP